jgi:hypothetical protein
MDKLFKNSATEKKESRSSGTSNYIFCAQRWEFLECSRIFGICGSEIPKLLPALNLRDVLELGISGTERVFGGAIQFEERALLAQQGA